MEKKIIVIGIGFAGNSADVESIIAKHGDTFKGAEIVDLNKLSPEEARKKLEEIYPKEQEKPFVLKAPEPMPEIFIEKPVKPRHNSSRHNEKKRNFFE